MESNNIQLSTRRNILDGFSIARISWYGNVNQVDFLGRLYDLSSLPSFDNRYKTASEDIHKPRRNRTTLTIPINQQYK